MKKCVVCKINKSDSLCKKCSINPFRIEEYRQILAREKNKILLINTYNARLPEINDLNTANFWDAKLESIKSIKKEDGMTKNRIKIAVQFMPKNAITILDIGAGYGYLEELLSKLNNINMFANDFSPLAVKNLKKRFKGNFSIQSIYKLNYQKNIFDTIFVLEVLEHIPPSKIITVLKNIKTLLKKDGVLIVSVPMNEYLETMKLNPSGHVRNYNEDLVTAELELAGFKILESRTLYAFKDFYLLKKLAAKIIKNKWKANNIIIKAKAQ